MDSVEVAFYLAVASVIGGAITAFILRDIRRTEAIKPYIVIGAIMALSASCATYSYAYFTIGVKEISIGSMFDGKFIFAKIKNNSGGLLIAKECLQHNGETYFLVCSGVANHIGPMNKYIAEQQGKQSIEK